MAGAQRPPAAPVTLADSELSEMSKVERLKAESEGLFWVEQTTICSSISNIR